MPDITTEKLTAAEIAEQIIREYIEIGCKLADTGAPAGLDVETWTRAIHQLRHLHLAEPHLPAHTIVTALGVDLTVEAQLAAIGRADRRAAYPANCYGIPDALWLEALHAEGYEISRRPHPITAPEGS